MASLPPQRPAEQRRASPHEETSSSQQEHLARTNSFSAQSVDSQTLLLNSPPRETAKPAVEEQEEAPKLTNTPQEEEDEPRKCWICFNDETEDDETSSEWRSPCTCSLVAHEKCLLDWIADMEAPNNRRRAGTRASKIQCPQCKSEIKIARPRSFVVDAVRLGERLTGTLLLPGFAIVTGTALYSTMTLAGTHTIYQIFGTQDALQILAPLYEKPDMRITSPLLRMLMHLAQHWRLDLGLPLIPTVLVASRTTFADSFLPFLPLIFFASSGQPGDELMQLQWPPSAAFSFAALPYLRGFYNAFYDRVCLPKEQQWLKEIQPRAGTEDAADAQLADDHDHDHDHHDHDHEEVNEVEIEVDFDIFGDWNGGGGADHHDHDHAHVQAPDRPIDAPPLDDDEMPALIEVAAAPAPNVPLQPAQPRRQRVRRERNIAFSTTSLADTILGALIFPSIAAAMGELLRHTLPSSWVNTPSSAPSLSWLGGWITTGGKVGEKGRPTGFLQTRWGRSLVGGCLFVGLKDAVLLYVRWKMAQNHRRRRILDSEDRGKRVGRGS
ncbi:hypothetical protein HBH56_040610 [Parastagonospora nodorum]|uniref:RING-CH-type domain-containing protein n=2 Tax=Phaeosphaeria nodorum (strain SN15 / ATCC MYA-4574 / FGSC 10173) TaxID=321614 RepID=A0A7U2EU14_PHANO|nr:hypothetical protein SNOG_07888 [Parastagonospora nodorum SN15]KAH3917452.1 hypothetical protein HBH56_040610 [Parastagonospora nodorum]EAT84164.1 hypothetical protein SNOG_07888 [Parastagonospora nodorum SN15]KAH3933353.1 hypothetical protein HBH54_068360 [Parastagonospora nodorum]KAH4139541.1 hypothetical protein HBH45_095300 [Parastagonospora nodorum]KAH4165365.1 hypothetical protein HBH43_143710 [Parastagonospora nodorum]